MKNPMSNHKRKKRPCRKWQGCDWDVVAASECRNIMSEREENANLFAFDERRNYWVMKSRYSKIIKQKLLSDTEEKAWML